MTVRFWFGEHRETSAHTEGFYTPRCTKQWQKALANAWLRKFGDEIIFPEVDVEVTVLFFFKNGHSADPDNLLRRCLNALNGLAWCDDNQVMRVVVERIHGADRDGVEITIKPYRPLPRGNGAVTEV